MRTQATGSASPLEQRHVPVQVKLAAAWASLMFLYVYVDILSFYMPGVIDDIQAGKVWMFEITQTWAFGSLLLMTIPILMVALSTALPARANRVTNLVVASVYVLVAVASALGGDWRYFSGLAGGLEVSVLVLILRYAWTWPRTARPTPVNHGVAGIRKPLARAG